ncbi:MAG: helix-turn-helix domain-containing protein [Oscillospiraceae bacterium]
MKNKFATRILELRKERGLSQKDAAEKLGISQALLSHYEKGIRECTLDFVCKIASFYDVSCDYVLGTVAIRRSLDEEFDKTDIVQDAEFRTSTLFRAAAMLHDSMELLGNNSSEKIKNYFALCIYQLAVLATNCGAVPNGWVSFPPEAALSMSSLLISRFWGSEVVKPSQKAIKTSSEPLCTKTVIEKSEALINDYLKNVINIKN